MIATNSSAASEVKSGDIFITDSKTVLLLTYIIHPRYIADPHDILLFF